MRGRRPRHGAGRGVGAEVEGGADGFDPKGDVAVIANAAVAVRMDVPQFGQG